MPGLKPMFRNSLSAEGAKAVTIKAWAPKARMLMPNSGRFVRLCVRLTILNLLKVYMNLYLRFLHFKFFKVLKQIMYLWIKWIMERCYPHLWWYFWTRVTWDMFPCLIFNSISRVLCVNFCKYFGFQGRSCNKKNTPLIYFGSTLCTHVLIGADPTDGERTTFPKNCIFPK